MNVFVTGATGFVGSEVVRQLRERGHAIRILVRDPQSHRVRDWAARAGAEARRGDVTDRQSLDGALDGIDAVIHLVGIISEVGRMTFETVHTLGTQNLLSAAVEAKVPRWLHMSALGTRPDAVSRYHATKWAAEQAVRQSGLSYTIFRPSLIFGPEDHFVNLFAGMSRFSPFLPVIGSGRTRYQPVAVEVVARAFVNALTKTETVGQTYDLGGPDTLTLPEMLRDILQQCGRRRLLLRIPVGLAWCQATALEWLWPALLRQAPPLNRDQVRMLQEDNTGDASKAEAVLDLPRIGFREGIAKYLAKKQP